jgi:hypothetical protein
VVEGRTRGRVRRKTTTFPLCSYPSFADHAVCVGATGPQGLPSWYSNFPNNKTMLGFRAPGGFGSVFCEDDLDILVDVCGRATSTARAKAR